MINHIKKIQTQKGFTLIEMAIAMIIVSLLVAFASVAFSGMLRRGYEKNTFKDMEIIADAIAIYSQKHMRIPCPAAPDGDGTERNSAGGTIFGQCRTVADSEGTVPYATLGLPQHLTRDRFGNFITYRVSLTSAQRPTESTTAGRLFNNWCMTRPYWHADTGNDGTTDTYTNLAKAAFCRGTWNPEGVAAGLAGPAGDISIQGSFGALPNTNRQTAGSGGVIGEYRPSTSNPPPYASLLNTVPPSFVAYTLVSHGQNGAGAYTGIGTNKSAGAVGAEAENANSDMIYNVSDRLASSAPGAGGIDLFRPDIDDIIYWQTPTQIMGRLGGMSCSHP